MCRFEGQRELVIVILSRAETCSCTLGSNVNTPLPQKNIFVLDKNIHSTLIRCRWTFMYSLGIILIEARTQRTNYFFLTGFDIWLLLLEI